MIRNGLLSTALGTALLFGGPAFAQSGTSSSGAIGEMQRERMNPATPSVPLQDRNAAEADRLALREPTQWLQQAQEALQQNRMGEATELLERAETRLLTRSTAPDRATMPASGPMLDRITAAREHLAQRNRMGAERELGAALALAPRYDNNTMSGADTGGSGLTQGGGATTNGSATLRDQGTTGRSMARADINLAQQSAPVDQTRTGNPAPAVPGAGPAVETPRGAPPAGSLSPPGASTTGRELSPDDAARRVGPSGTSPQGAPSGAGGAGGGSGGGGGG